MIPEICKMSNNKYGHVDFLIFFSSVFSLFLQLIVKKNSDSITICNSKQNTLLLNYLLVFVEPMSKIETNLLSY